MRDIARDTGDVLNEGILRVCDPFTAFIAARRS